MTAVSESRNPPLVGGAVAVVSLAGMAVLAYGVLTTSDLAGHGGMAAAVPLLGVSSAGWCLWLGARLRPDLVPAGLPALVAMAAAGGALVGVSPVAVVFLAVAAVGATVLRPLRQALPVILCGAGAMAASVPLAGRSWGVTLGGVSALLIGTVVGTSRRDAQERATQASARQVAEARAEAEAARAELLAGRNHLARELHDVLAHTLSALSVQLEALDTRAAGADPELGSQLDAARRLVRDGLEEARGAVAALREDLPALPDRLGALAAERRAGLRVSGLARELGPEVSLTLYRVAQEALTNVAKHAPGARAEVHLAFCEDHVALTVADPGPPGPGPVDGPEGSGGGYGLQGIRERVLLIGGTVEAGPSAEGGWRVEASVPVPVPVPAVKP